MTAKKTAAKKKPAAKKPAEKKTTTKVEVEFTTMEVKEVDPTTKVEGKKDKKPAYLKLLVPDFAVGTKEYHALVTDFNEKFGTHWNPHRVRPAVFFGLYKQMKEYYEG